MLIQKPEFRILKMQLYEVEAFIFLIFFYFRATGFRFFGNKIC